MKPKYKNQEIAVIGLSCQFPSAENIESFWQVISQGREVFRTMPEQRRVNHTLGSLNDIKGSFIDNPYLFDNSRFSIEEKDSIIIDPQQRIMLELSQEAIENAGYKDLSDQVVGVFVGADQMAYQEMITSQFYRSNTIDYLAETEAFKNLSPEIKETLQSEMDALRKLNPLPPDSLVGVLPNMIPGRIAHVLNLKGPALTVDTACSSALVAVHLAIESLNRFECNQALAGGVNLNLTPSVFQYMSAAGVISPSGKCIPFSKDSDGILLGEGAGMILLKRLEDAQRDNDPIWAVIQGSGINNDGRSLGIMAPSWKGQLALLKNTYEKSKVDPASISAIEAHGTSTRIGDGVELSVIERFFPLDPDNPITVGSVKSNFGHTLAASGITGLLKMILAIHHKQLPPSIHEEIDSEKKLSEKGIKIPNQLSEWKSDGLRTAGVSSFGFGGTNAHIILREPTKAPVFKSILSSTNSRKSFSYDFFPKTHSRNEPIYFQKWTKTDLEEIKITYDPSNWLILGYEEEALKLVQKQLSERGTAAFCVLCSGKSKDSDFIRKGEKEFCIDAGNPEHYQWLMSSFPQTEDLGVFYMASSLDKDVTPNIFIKKILSGFRFLMIALEQHGNSKIWIQTSEAYAVQSSEKCNPYQRSISVLAAGALEENPSLRGTLLDYYGPTNENISTLISFLGYISPSPIIQRNQNHFSPELHPVAPLDTESKKISINPKGTYLIIGGSSGIGMHLAEHLKNKEVQNIIITGTRPKDKLLLRILSLLGERFRYVQNNILDKGSVSKLIDDLFNEFGRIDGIIFSAGVINYGSIINKSQEEFERVLQVKVIGAQNLSNALINHHPDFVYTLSSISALTPGWAGGISDYAAANAFLDGLAEEKNHSPFQWTSGSWGAWKDVGMAASMKDFIEGFNMNEALDIFDKSMSLKYPHLIFLPTNQSEQFTPAFASTEAKNHETIKNIPKIRSSQNVIKVTTAIENNEHNVVDILKEYIAKALELPVREIDENISFYELGLDSLSAMDVAQKIEEKIGIELHPTILFEYDTITALANYLGGDMMTETKSNPTITPSTSETFPLIGTQETFYATQQFFPEKPCNILVNVELHNPFKHETLELALQTLIKRHDALRLAFKMTEEGPMQYTMDDIKSPLEFYKYQTHQELLNLEDKFVNEIFDWENPPYFKLVHVTGPENSSLMLIVHHLILDAWSMHLIVNDLIELYRKISIGIPPKHVGNEYPFKSFVNQYKSLYSIEKLNKAKAYWVEDIKDAKWGIALPYKQKIESKSNYKMVAGELNKATTKELMELNQENKISIFHSLLAGLFMTLNQQTGRKDMIIRIANANRDNGYPEIESLTGCLADALPIRIKINDEDNLLSVASKVKHKVLNGLRHNCLSSQNIAELPIERQEDGPIVLSPVGLSFVPIHHLSKSDLPFENIRCRTALPFTDISLICFLEEDQLKCCWNYDEAVFETKDIEQLKENFLRILSNKTLRVNPQDLPFALPPLEMPDVDLFPDHPLIHQKVWKACDLFKERNAIIEGEVKLTYNELKIRSQLIANTLQNNLDAREDIVCVFDYPGISATLSITAILASGRAFVPIDPDWPIGRTGDIISHSQARTILTIPEHLPTLLSFVQVLNNVKRIVLVGQDLEKTDPIGDIQMIHGEIESKPIINETIIPSTDQLAYVMYTSGTSGRPKGVMVSHKAAIIFLNWVSEVFSINEKDRFIHSSSLGFGGSIRQIFSTILAGACNYPIPRLQLKDPFALLTFLEENQITLFNTVPSVINSIVDHVSQQSKENAKSFNFPKLRFLLLGGEILPSKTVLKWREYFSSQAHIANLYGSTETIVNATFYLIGPNTQIIQNENIPIGIQKKGCIVRIIDNNGRLCHPGESGEICVGGPCLATGYYNDIKLTEEKFIPLYHLGYSTPFYKTGDIGKIDRHGIFSYIGRNDSQIQLHGNRIELSEIEHTIFQIEQVKNAVVLDHKTEQLHRLVAFVELSNIGIQPSSQQVRDFVAQNLPSYMVPHMVKIMPALPLNQAGKTNRKDLRKILESEYNKNKKVEIERIILNPTEEKISSIWQKLLKTEVRPEDDFFRLGGDSIMALEMLHKLRPFFKVLPRAVSLFKNRKLSDFAKSIDQLNNKNNVSLNEPVITSKSKKKITLSPSHKGFIFLEKLIPDSAPNWAGLLFLNGVFKLEVFAQALKIIIERHQMLRTTFRNEGTNAYQHLVKNYIAPVELFDISSKAEVEQSKSLNSAFLEIKKTYFNLKEYPLFKVQFYKTGENSGAMIICIHHIITDGWSAHILLNELIETYDRITEGRSLKPGNTHPSYNDCIPYMNTVLSKDQLLEHKIYWREILKDLPTHVSSSELNPPDDETLTFTLPPGYKEQLLEWAKVNGVTLYNLLLTVNTRSLMKLYESNTVLINTAINGRDFPIENIQYIVGCFARSLPLKVFLENDSDIFASIKMVEDALIEALEHQDIPTAELLKITSKSGFMSAILSLNRFYFSYMDFSSLGAYESTKLSLNWDKSVFSFNAGGAGSEIMTSIHVEEKIRINLNGYSSIIQKEKFKKILLKEINSLFKTTPNLDTALISYFPGKKWLASLTKMVEIDGSIGDLTKSLVENGSPILLEWVSTPYGTSGAIFMPYSSDELLSFSMKKRIAEVKKAIKVAADHGATLVSLAGILPAITKYGYAVSKVLNTNGSIFDAIKLTTGHSSTVVAVIKTIEKVLNEINILIENINVAVLGFGSIGQSSLSLLLDKIGHPDSIVIVDLESQLTNLQKPIENLKSKFSGKLEIIGTSENVMPPELFDSHLIIGASSTGLLIDTAQLKKGTILVDDSFPPLIDISSGISRMKKSKDVLLLGGGKLLLAKNQVRQYNTEVPEKIIKPLVKFMGTDGMPGCRAEPLLINNNTNLPVTIGLVKDQTAEIFWEECTRLGIEATPLHLGGYVIPKSLLSKLQEIYNLL